MTWLFKLELEYILNIYEYDNHTQKGHTIPQTENNSR